MGFRSQELGYTSSMYTTRCPQCKIDYSDSENKLSIALFNACLLCRLDESRWENEGGNNAR